MKACRPNDHQPPELTFPVNEEHGLLPCETPKPPRLVFSGAGEGWPPQPVGRSNVRMVEAQPIAGSLNDDYEAEVRRAATAEPRVAALLGERYAHIHTDLLWSGKQRPCDLSRPLGTRQIYFSHSNNIAVEVQMAGLRVTKALTVRGFQPPEGQEEIEQAIAIARADPRLSHAVRDLDAAALLNTFAPEDPYHGLRVLWVTFYEPGEREGEKPALFCAAVDIVNRRVLVTREEPPLQEAQHA